MARAVMIVKAEEINNDVLEVAESAAIRIYETNGTTPIAQSLYAAESGGSPLTQPLTTSSLGVLYIYVDTPQECRVSVNGGSVATGWFEPNPDDIVTLTGAQTLTNKIINGAIADELRMTRPATSGGLIFTPEYFYLTTYGDDLDDIDPGVTDETPWIQAAINAAVAVSISGGRGGIVELQSRQYNFSTLNISSSISPTSPEGATACITIRGSRAQSTTGPTNWGTYLYPNVAAGNTTAAKTRTLIDVSGSTYISIRDLRIGRGDDQYGSGVTGGSAANVNPASAIMLSGSLNPATLNGWESTAHELHNVLIDGYFTSGTIVAGGSSFHMLNNVQAYNRYAMVNAPGAPQGGGYALILAGYNFINPDLPGTGTDATRYVMYSPLTGELPVDQYQGSGNNVYIDCQFWTQGASTSAAIRLADSCNNLFIGGAAGTASAAPPIVEITDQLAPLGNFPLESALLTFVHFEFAGGSFAVYCGSETTVHHLRLISGNFSNVFTAVVGGINSATQIYDGLRIENPRVQGVAPISGLIYLNNTQNAVDRLLNAYLDCHGLALSNVGSIDETSIIINPGAYVGGGTGNQNRGFTLGSTGMQLGNNVALSALESGGTVRAVLKMDASDIWNVGTTSNQTNLFGTSVNLGTAGGTVLSAKANGDATVGLASRPQNAVAGFAYIPTIATGTPSGTPTGVAGFHAMCFDPTNNKLWIYDGGWLGVVLS